MVVEGVWGGVWAVGLRRGDDEMGWDEVAMYEGGGKGLGSGL